MPLPGMLQKRSLNDLEVNMPSLLDAAEAFSKLGKKSVEIDQAACVRVRHRHASCMACFQVCAHEAIARDDDGLLAIDNHLCTGCGACASVCPTSALQLVEDVPELVRAAIESIAEQADALQDDTDPSSADSLRTEKPCGTLTISCEYLRNQEAALEERAHSEAGLRVKASPDEIDPPKAKTEHEAECSLTLSCLAALDEAALISAACSNVEVRYESGDCACCPNAQGELIATLGEQATRFLGAFLAAATPERPLPAARALPAAWSLVTPQRCRKRHYQHFARTIAAWALRSLHRTHDRLYRRSSGGHLLREHDGTGSETNARSTSFCRQGHLEAHRSGAQ